MNHTTTQLRRALLTVLVAVAALAGLSAQAPQAAAEEGYRYWGYYQWDNDQWGFAQQGADEIVPADGSVEGWRFAQSTTNDARMPRADGDFAKICAEVQPVADKKRVAVVIDQGTAEDAPTPGDKPNGQVQGTCVLAAPEATGSIVLEQVTQVRKEKMTCGIGGYPSNGCGDAVQIDGPVTDTTLPLTVQPPVGVPGTAPDQPTGEAGNSTGPILVGAGIVVVLAGGGVLLTRRAKKRQDQQV